MCASGKSLQPGWRCAAIAVLALCLVASHGAEADTGLPAPQGPVLLTVSGAIQHTNVGKEAQFDRAMLTALGDDRVRTSTTWTDGPKTFGGFLGRKLLAAVGAKGTELKAVALNDYFVAIPVQDLEMYDVLFATSMDGVTLTRRDKGPIWIVYPRDAHTDLRDAKTDSKFIWQLTQIVVR